LTEEENEPEKNKKSHDKKGEESKENAGGLFSFMNDPNNKP
jgi:hypothetical protein